MDVTAETDASCSPDRLFAEVDDLSRYPAWLRIVPRAVPVDGEAPGGGPPAEAPAWTVDLRGRLGPLARSKRLRMVRTVHDVEGRRVRFERAELDGRSHSPWVLDAEVAATGDGSRLTMRLHYGGGFGGSLLERMLRDEIECSRPALRALVETEGAEGAAGAAPPA